MNLNSTFIMEKRFFNLFNKACIIISMFMGTLIYSQGNDTEPPTTPTNLRLEQDVGILFFAWDASTDNVGVDYYEVYNNGERFYTLDQTRLGDFSSVNQTFVFTVKAVDKAGNKSGFSTSFTISPDSTAGPCDGIDEWSSNAFYQVGDRVTYRGNLYELQNSSWAFISSCSNAKTENAIPPPAIMDTEAPSTPINLRLEQDAGILFFAWDASTDNVGVDYYEVYNNGELFYALGQTRLGDFSSVNQTFVFTVKAVDKAGNKSEFSTSFTISPDSTTGPCDGIDEWRSGVTYQTGDRVTYAGNLYERQPSSWAFISSCNGSNSVNAENADSEAPTAPTGLSYAYDAGDDATWISWNPSIDNVGVDYYIMHENGKYFYATDADQTKLGFGGKPKKTSTFTVQAVDKAGNKSAFSEPLIVYADTTDICAGIDEWRSGVIYQVGDRVTYAGNLYERQPSRWAFISSCSGSKSANSQTPDRDRDNSFITYPNPVRKELRIISNPSVNPSTYTITDMQGRVITKGNYNSSVNVENLPKGIYIINMTSKDNVSKSGSIFVKE